MKRTDTLIIGGGQAGLAISRCLHDRAIEHVIFERGRIGERWRSERWDSLRLLTPNWLSRLPNWSYQGPDPDGFMTMAEVISYLEGYARSFSAPVYEKTTVLEVESFGSGYRVTTNQGTWLSKNVVIATGHCDVPYIPRFGRELMDGVQNLVPTEYRNPDMLPEGGVLIVGSSASGIQLADEIHSSGRPVTLAVGKHTRLPRRYRGKDIFWWLEQLKILDQTPDQVHDFELSRHQPSLQLVGRPDHNSLDLPMLQERGVRLTGRVVGVESGQNFLLDDNLVSYTATADAKLAKLLKRIDDFVIQTGLTKQVGDPEPVNPFFWPAPAPTEVNLKEVKIRTVIWATGFTRKYPWLKVPVLDEQGEIMQKQGVTPHPGLYVLGLQFLRHRKSAFIDGVGQDAGALAQHIAERCRTSQCRAA
jgi:putative flavoprotein involved in K+ transport